MTMPLISSAISELGSHLEDLGGMASLEEVCYLGRFGTFKDLYHGAVCSLLRAWGLRCALSACCPATLLPAATLPQCEHPGRYLPGIGGGEGTWHLGKERDELLMGAALMLVSHSAAGQLPELHFLTPKMVVEVDPSGSITLSRHFFCQLSRSWCVITAENWLLPRWYAAYGFFVLLIDWLIFLMVNRFFSFFFLPLRQSWFCFCCLQESLWFVLFCLGHDPFQMNFAYLLNAF